MSAAAAVVIATRNRRDALLRTLARLAALPERPPVVVVDNASSDGTPRAVRARFPAVHVIEAEQNLGAGARTLGAWAAGTPYVAFSDDDSWWAPGALAAASELLARHPRLAVIAARILVEPGGRLDPACALMSRSPLPSAGEIPGPRVLGFVACGAVVRSSAFLACGGFDSRLGVGGEEALLALDLEAAGFDLAYVDEIVAHHEPSGRRNRRSRARVELRNRLWITWLRRPGPVALRRTLQMIGTGGRAVPWAFAAALRGAPWVLAERRVLPPDVERSVRVLEAAG